MPIAGEPLSAWADALSRSADQGRDQEAELRHDIFLVLGPYLRDEVGLADTAVQHERTTTAGRYDSMFGRALVEYKRPRVLDTDTERRRAARQALDYMEDVDVGADVVVITDGRTWGILRDPAEAMSGQQIALDLGLEIKVDPLDRFQWRSNSPETAERVLSLLASVRATPVTSRTIVATLGLSRSEPNELLGALAAALTDREPGSRADMFFSQWLQLAGVAYGIASKDTPWPRQGRTRVLGDQLAGTLGNASFAESIFALHTFIALASKLIGAEVLSQLGDALDRRPSQWISLDRDAFAQAVADMEHGDLVEALGAPGLFAGDLFGWYTPLITRDKELQRTLRRFFGCFSELAWAQLALSGGQAGDLLRDFYISTVPRLLRRALGEFFTPQWLAERVFTQAVRIATADGKPLTRILDPACGSGTFVVVAFNFLLRRARANGVVGVARLHEAIDGVNAFDINPISTLMTRVNLLLNLGSEAEQLPEISFRVFQADSILLPEHLMGQVRFDQEGDYMRLPLVIGDLHLPAGLSSISGVRALVRVLEGALDAGRSIELFKVRLRAELRGLGLPDEVAESTLEPAAAIYARLAELHGEGRNGVWARVIEQAFAPTLIGAVDLVVGNPPWISWKHTPQAWQDRSESLWRAYGLWQRRRRGGGVPLADLSTLLLARAMATYAPQGVVALLLPKSFLMADPGGRAIRFCRLLTQAEDLSGVLAPVDLNFQPRHVDDFSVLNPFPDAATTPIAVYTEPGSAASFPVPATRWTRAQAGNRLQPYLDWHAARARLVGEDVELSPLHSGDRGSIWVERAATDSLEALPPAVDPAYRWGQGFHTRGADGLYFCEVLSTGPTPEGLVRIRTLPALGENTRGEEPRQGVVEAAYIWPLLRGEAVNRLSFDKPSTYCILPHDPSNPAEPLSALALAERAPRLFDFLEPLIARLARRSAYDLDLSEATPFAIQGAFEHLRASQPYVAARYIAPEGKPPACVVLPTLDPKLGRTTVPYFNNKSNFLRTESASEAWYIATFINAPSTQSLIGRISMSTTISPRKLASVPVPRFDMDDARHRALAQWGEASVSEGDWHMNEGKIDELVRTLAATMMRAEAVG